MRVFVTSLATWLIMAGESHPDEVQWNLRIVIIVLDNLIFQ
jgi:hypothetical protein